MDPNNQSVNQAPNGLDMDAINAAVEASAGQGGETETSFDVNKINLDNTPTTNEELQQQLKENPGMSLAGGPSVNPAPSAPTSDVSQNVPIGDTDPFSSPMPPAKKEEEEFTIDSEATASKSSVAIANSTAKMQENAMKALNAVKPKDSTGVIIMASIGCVVVIGIIITIIFALQ